MAEFTSTTIQTVAAGQNLPLTETAIKGSNCINHRAGAGNVTLRGLTNQCKALFKVSFGGNIAIPTGGTVGAISVALAVGGLPSVWKLRPQFPSALAAAGATGPLLCSFTEAARDPAPKEKQNKRRTEIIFLKFMKVSPSYTDLSRSI